MTGCHLGDLYAVGVLEQATFVQKAQRKAVPVTGRGGHRRVSCEVRK
jgi:hypothetical protein